MNDILVSAVITTHNRLSLLKKAIESVKDQTYRPIELIVVDDCSTDGTKEYCETQDFKYIYIPSNESRGGNYARNLGIIASNGKYIALLDDDDTWLPEKIEKQLNLIETKKCGLVYCGKILETINSVGECTQVIQLPNPQNQGDMSKRIFGVIPCVSSTLFISKQCLMDVGLFDESLRFWQDYDLSIRLAQLTLFYFVNEPLVNYLYDCRDANKLTNKFYGWLSAVEYLKNKHHSLYENLPMQFKLQAHRNIWGDAALRAKQNHLYFRYIWYQFILKFSKIIQLFLSTISKY
jgi:glycosyltransferase involved in cell wall biosynthesis